MFSTAQQQVVDTLVPTYLEQGYKSYIVYTHQTISNNYYTVPEPDLVFIFSKDKIEARTLYQFRASEDSIKIEYRTSNYSTSQYADNTERFVISDFSGNINVPIYEHIYTNAAAEAIAIQPDVMKGGYQSDSIQTQAGNFILCAFLLVFLFFKMWQVHK